MTPEQRARFQTILDEYDAAIAAINRADETAVDTSALARDLLVTVAEMIKGTDAVITAARRTLEVNKQIMDANRKANDQVRILLNEL